MEWSIRKIIRVNTAWGNVNNVALLHSLHGGWAVQSDSEWYEGQSGAESPPPQQFSQHPVLQNWSQGVQIISPCKITVILHIRHDDVKCPEGSWSRNVVSTLERMIYKVNKRKWTIWPKRKQVFHGYTTLHLSFVFENVVKTDKCLYSGN